MASIQIQRGDTLSQLAVKHGTTVSALMQANSQIQDADLIYAGAQLNIPGASDGFDAGGGQRRMAGMGNLTGESNPVGGNTGPGTRGPGGSPLEIARQHLGTNAGDLKYQSSGVGADMEDWVPNNVNCANFVSAVLEQAGQIGDSQHSASVYGLMGNLDNDSNFQRVSLQNAQPGDVVSMKTPGGQHVVLFAGWENGKPQFIGSNNVNADGSQRISMTSMNYPILAVHHYRG